MVDVKVMKITGGSVEEVLSELLKGGETGDEGLLGLERKPEERKADSGPKKENVLLTLREDLVSTRRRLLAGMGRKAVLRDLDYTIDQLDNALGEM